MSLNLFNNLFNNVNKEKREEIKEFSKELEDYLNNVSKVKNKELNENDNFSNDIEKNIKDKNFDNEINIEDADKNEYEFKLNENHYDKIGENLEKNNINLNNFEEFLITEFIDKFKLERADFLQNYDELKNYEDIYFIYGENEKNEYLATNCKIENSADIFYLSKNEFQDENAINKIITIEDDKYVINEKLSNNVKNFLENILKEIFEKQNQIMQERRIEGHLYEFVEQIGNTVCLIDNTLSAGISFEEVFYSSFENAKEGDIFKYENGNYYKVIKQ